MSKIAKSKKQMEKINKILSFEELEERLEMGGLSVLQSYCFNGNTTYVSR